MLPWGAAPQFYGQTGFQPNVPGYHQGLPGQPSVVSSPSTATMLMRNSVGTPTSTRGPGTPQSAHEGPKRNPADLEAEAKRAEQKQEERRLAREKEEEKTHVKTRVGAKVGPDRSFPEGRYVVHKILGKGTFGKVFECSDLKYEGSLVAVKIVRNEPLFKKAALNEIKVLKKLDGQCGLLRLCRDFTHLNHVCISVDLYGESLEKKMKRLGSLTIEQVADVGLQLLHGINHMHKCGITHTDLKTDNVIVYHRPDPATGLENDDPTYPLSVRIIDLGSATFDDQWHQPLVGTNEYRAPENILHTGWSKEMDVWSIGCIMAELTKGKGVFGEQLADNVHLMIFEKTLEKPLPDALLRKAWSKGTAAQNKTLVIQGQNVQINRRPSDALQERNLRDALVLREEIADPQLRDVLEKIFEYDPAKRAKAGPLRSHPFFARARFDRSDIDVPTAYPPVLPVDDPRHPLLSPVLGPTGFNTEESEQDTLSNLRSQFTLKSTRSNPPDPFITPPPSTDMKPRQKAHEPFVSPMMVPTDATRLPMPPAMHSPESQRSPERMQRATALATPEGMQSGTALATTPKSEGKTKKDGELTEALARAHLQADKLSQYVQQTQAKLDSAAARLASREDSLKSAQFLSPSVKSAAVDSPKLLQKTSNTPLLNSVSGAQQNRQGSWTPQQQSAGGRTHFVVDPQIASQIPGFQQMTQEQQQHIWRQLQQS